MSTPTGSRWSPRFGARRSLIGETGWPEQGAHALTVLLPSPVCQISARFLSEILERARQQNFRQRHPRFEAHDEPWQRERAGASRRLGRRT